MPRSHYLSSCAPARSPVEPLLLLVEERLERRALQELVNTLQCFFLVNLEHPCGPLRSGGARGGGLGGRHPRVAAQALRRVLLARRVPKQFRMSSAATRVLLRCWRERSAHCVSLAVSGAHTQPGWGAAAGWTKRGAARQSGLGGCWSLTAIVSCRQSCCCCWVLLLRLFTNSSRRVCWAPQQRRVVLLLQNFGA